MVYLLPALLLGVFLAALVKKIPAFDLFVTGAKAGLQSCMQILFPVLGFMLALSMLRASGFLELVCRLLAPILSKTGLNEDLLSLALLRPLSGSGALGVLATILSRCKNTSFTGRCASVMAGSTETTFYTLSVYFGSIGVSDTRHTVFAAVFADIGSVFFSLLVCRLFFGL